MFETFTFPVLDPDPGIVVAMHALKKIESQEVSLLALNQEAELWRLELHLGIAVKLLQVDIPGFNPDHPMQIVLSEDERYAAVSNRFGQHAALFDLKSQQEIMTLFRDDYHHNTCTFPLAFAELNNRTVFIKGTEWNRLDLVDVESGELLTERESPVYNSDNRVTSEHYLDYFYGKLHLSPGREWIINTGWIWHPIGRIRAWNLPSWSTNCWESEDGTTVHDVWEFTEDWDYPVAWMDDFTFAVWGKISPDMYDEDDLLPYGKDKYSTMLAFFDVRTGERKKFFVHMPEYRMRSDIAGVFVHPHAQLAQVQGKLVLWGPDNGLSVLNPHTGDMEYTEQTLCPDLYHDSAGLFLEIDESGRFTGLKLS